MISIRIFRHWNASLSISGLETNRDGSGASPGTYVPTTMLPTLLYQLPFLGTRSTMSSSHRFSMEDIVHGLKITQDVNVRYLHCLGIAITDLLCHFRLQYLVCSSYPQQNVLSLNNFAKGVSACTLVVCTSGPYII